MRTPSAVHLGSLSAAIALMTVAPSANAQTTEKTQRDLEAADAIPDGAIVVTAQRREQSLQDVPISITALSDETIKEANLTDTLSFARLAPNTQVRIFGNTPNIFIRGIGLNDFNSSSVSPIAVYRDEFALVAAASQVYPIFDLQRIEVLKGPQGTLFGKNTTGGAVSYVSRRPGYYFEGYASATVGRFGERAFEAAMTIPVSDAFRLRISGSKRRTDGDRINIYNNSRGHVVDMQAARIVSVIEPNADLKITTIGYAGRNKSDYPVGKPIGTFPGGVNVLGYADPYPDDPRIVNYNISTRTDQWDLGITNIIEYQLGAVALKSVTGYDKSKGYVPADVDGSPQSLDEVYFLNRTRSFSQEFNLSGETGPLQWIAGLFYSWDKLHYPVKVDLLGELEPLGADLPLAIEAGRTTRSYAGYAQATYSLTPDFRITGGLRYTKDKLDSEVATSLVYGLFNPDVPNADPIPIIPYRRVKQGFGRWSYRAAAEYDVTPDVMAYASINHSFKQGGVYLTPLSSPAEAEPFSPETNTAYEAGVKSTLLGGALRFNIAGFYNDYGDMQVFAVRPTTNGIPSLTIQNAASAHIYGVETDFTLRPTHNFRIDGGIGWLHARFADYPNAAIDPVTGESLDFSGNPLPGAPDWSGNIAATYDLELDSDWGASARVDYSFVGRRYFDSTKIKLIGDEGYSTLDARLSIKPPGGVFEVALWGRNLTDTTYLQNATDLTSIGFSPQFYGARRSYGVTMSASF